VSSALIIGWIFGVVLEITVFMAAYIPLITFASGYHAKTPIRCYIFSVIWICACCEKSEKFHFMYSLAKGINILIIKIFYEI
jgi:accessory gene regulator protein AgrB